MGDFETKISNRDRRASVDSQGFGRSFLRLSDGTYLDIDHRNAAATYDTYAYGINDAGRIVGWYWDAESVSHGFIRSPEGIFTTFDVPNHSGLMAEAINNSGQAVGAFWDQSGGHGFLYNSLPD
ncbi:MAG TPA: hypothetical protein VNN13_03425 [Methylomirabilota bacterium]|nr:hypothetical protein [Methylomirabilota bacterium]